MRKPRKSWCVSPFALGFALYTASALAGDANGYTATYECRAGGPACNVDVKALALRACDQVISPSTPWSRIDWAQRTICLAAGDHTHKRTLAVPSFASADPGTYKVLRYYRPIDNDDDPWRQSAQDQAKLHQLILDGADGWVVHRLTFPPVRDTSAMDRVFLKNGASDLIMNRLLIEGAPHDASSNIYSAIGAWGCAPGTADRTTIQNSVIRNNRPVPGTDPVGIAIECGTDVRIVNNEIYDWSSHNIQLGHNNGPTMPGAVIENNDSYVTPALFHSAGERMAAENPIELKAGGTSSKPLRVVQNRAWGSRLSDTSRCCIGGTGGVAIAVVPPEGGSLSYIEIKNNVIFDSQVGIVWASGISRNQSVIGNLFFDIRRFYSGVSSYGIELIKSTRAEVYLNTIIRSPQSWMYMDGGMGYGDVKCNAVLDSGARAGGTPADSTVVDYNAFYETQVYGINGDGQNIAVPIKSRAANTNYQAGDVLRIGSQCQSIGDPGCFLYIVTGPGTTSSSSPSYCTTLGCRVNDGTASLQAIRGPYAFKRRLKTAENGELVVVPYARVHSAAPESRSCPSTLADRSGIGINDDSF